MSGIGAILAEYAGGAAARSVVPPVPCDGTSTWVNGKDVVE